MLTIFLEGEKLFAINTFFNDIKQNERGEKTNKIETSSRNIVKT